MQYNRKRMILETKRLLLRTWQASDCLALCEINQDPRVMEFFPALQDKHATEQLLIKINQHYEQYGYTLYAVELKATGEFIGFIGLLNTHFTAHFTPAVEIGWRLAAEYWGQGYATEGAKAVLAYGFTTLNLSEIVSFTTAINQRSIRVMEKIGLQHNPADDFAHPLLTLDSPLSYHLLYRLTQTKY